MSVSRFPFWRVAPGERGGEYLLPVMPPATVGPEGAPHVMGGVALAAAVDALELASGQKLLWSNIQFLAPTTHAEELVVSCEQCGGGQSVGQWQAEIRSNGRLTHRISASLGAREPSEQRIFAALPEVPGPGECESLDRDWGAPGTLADQFDLRLAMTDEDRGVQALWSRSQAGFPADSGWLAIVSDFFLGAHPATRGGSSLDDTYRYIQSADDGWALTVTEFAAFDRGVVHGSARHFAEDGRLLAISSQSGVLPRIPRTP